MPDHGGPLFILVLLHLVGCPTHPEPPNVVGGYDLAVDGGGFTLTHAEHGDSLRDVRISAGTGEYEVTFSFGAFKFEDESTDMERPSSLGELDGAGGVLSTDLLGADGGPIGTLRLEPAGADAVWIRFEPDDPAADRVVLDAACDAEDHFLGLGGHAMDVDHVGQAFPLWVSEPGIGKSEEDEIPDEWFILGTRHASSYPVPFLLRPHQAHGLLADTTARVLVDLCHTDSERFSVELWAGSADFLLLSGGGPLDVVEQLTGFTGRIELPEPWVFAPWNDAVRGPDNVRAVAERLREFGAPSSVIWSEDWKGGVEDFTGYHLRGEWFLDEETYPDADGLAEELAESGFQWFAYFSPFVETETVTYEQAVADGVLIRDQAGDPYLFTGVTFHDTSLVDLTSPGARQWVVDRMEAALGHGFDGWMADYAEWLPHDAVLASGEDPMLVHNRYPVMWQELNRGVMADHEMAFFSRSGWAGATGLAPVVWAGDQRTSFDTDDGLPTIVPMGLGLAACGVPVYTHDIAGYQSNTNPPSDRELWYRWAALGAFSPVMRTHHGASDTENWQFDSDDETTQYWAELAREHTRLFPYRYGLARRASEQGTPMLLPTAFLFEDEDPARMDAWMLGEALLVAPVLERGVTSRQVDLPGGVQWYDWWTREPAASGMIVADIDQIPVFAAAGTTVPTFENAPDTLMSDVTDNVTDLEYADEARVVYLFGGGGEFVEGDGTSYQPAGTPTGPGEETVTLTTGTAEVAGVTVTINGPIERTYRLVVIP